MQEPDVTTDCEDLDCGMQGEEGEEGGGGSDHILSLWARGRNDDGGRVGSEVGDTFTKQRQPLFVPRGTGIGGGEQKGAKK